MRVNETKNEGVAIMTAKSLNAMNAFEFAADAGGIVVCLFYFRNYHNR